MGDIHGCATALETLLNRLQPGRDDRLVILGDVVDRGPDTRRCVELLLDVANGCRLDFLLGNHEEMMFNALAGGSWADGWLRYGGKETLASYGGADRIPPRHLEFLQAGVDYVETASAICVHANLQPHVPLPQQPGEWLRWRHLTGHERPHPSGKRIICGHTRQRSGLPAVLPGWVCIDTAACAGGYLTALNLETLDVLQTSEDGICREECPLSLIARPLAAGNA